MYNDWFSWKIIVLLLQLEEDKLRLYLDKTDIFKLVTLLLSYKLIEFPVCKKV